MRAAGVRAVASRLRDLAPGECRRSRRAWQCLAVRSRRSALPPGGRCEKLDAPVLATASPGERNEQARRAAAARDRQAEDDAVRGVRRDARRQRRQGRLRHRRLGVHGRARPLSARRHPLHLGRARAGRRATWPTATRACPGRHGVCIAQNGPGITNFVTSTAAAYWAHSPVVVITPETGSATLGLGGFQETEQLPIFSKITKFQAHVNNRARMAELTGARVRPRAPRARADAAQHPARFLLRRHRVRDPAADRDRARRRRREEPRRGGRAAGEREVPGDPLRRRRRDGRRAAPRRSRSPSCCRRRSPTATCTTIRSRRSIRCGSGRSATRAARRR